MYELCARREAEKNENGKKESKKIKNGCVYINLCISQVINCTTSYQFFSFHLMEKRKKRVFFSVHHQTMRSVNTKYSNTYTKEFNSNFIQFSYLNYTKLVIQLSECDCAHERERVRHFFHFIITSMGKKHNCIYLIVFFHSSFFVVVEVRKLFEFMWI